MHLIPRRFALAALVSLSMLGVTVSAAAAGTNTSITFSLDRSYLYVVGMDKVYPSTVTAPSRYHGLYEYPVKQPAVNPGTVLLSDPPTINVSDPNPLSEIRLEVYRRCKFSIGCQGTESLPNWNQYSPYEGDSAVAIRIKPAAKVNLGRVFFPEAGGTNVGNLTINLVSRNPIPNNRMKITLFQVSGQPKTTSGYPLDAFAHGWSRGNLFRTGPVWNGRYLAFIYDYEQGAGRFGGAPYLHRILGFVDVHGATTTTFDMDASCFGIDECRTLEPTPPVDGEFHPLPTARIVDSRVNRGVTGVVQPGDGRLADPNPTHRLAARTNHDFKVLGVGGVPAYGVGAVLLNVTALGGTSVGSLAVVQKPPRIGSVFEDQGSYYGGVPTATSQLHWKPGDIVSGQVLVRPGPGGKVRIANRSLGATHVLVDVLGYFDESQTGQDGLGLTAVPPSRVVESQSGLGTPAGPFAPSAQRVVAIRPGAIPADAAAVVASVSLSPMSGNSLLTVWPSDGARPGVATVSATPGQPRTNLVTSLLSAGGELGIYNGATASFVSVDVRGYFAAQTGSSGRVTTVNPVKVYGAGAFGANATATVNVSSKLSGIANPVAVYVNVALTGVKGTGYLTTDASAGPTGVVALRYNPGRDRANLVLVRLDPVTKTFKVRNVGAGGGTLTVDLVGVVTG